MSAGVLLNQLAQICSCGAIIPAGVRNGFLRTHIWKGMSRAPFVRIHVVGKSAFQAVLRLVWGFVAGRRVRVHVRDVVSKCLLVRPQDIDAHRDHFGGSGGNVPEEGGERSSNLQDAAQDQDGDLVVYVVEAVLSPHRAMRMPCTHAHGHDLRH